MCIRFGRCGSKIKVSPIIPIRRDDNTTNTQSSNPKKSDSTSSVVKKALVIEKLENEVANNNIKNVKKLINKNINKYFITPPIIQYMIYNSQSIEMEIMLKSYIQ